MALQLSRRHNVYRTVSWNLRPYHIWDTPVSLLGSLFLLLEHGALKQSILSVIKVSVRSRETPNAALQRLAHATYQRSPLTASPLQALVRRRAYTASDKYSYRYRPTISYLARWPDRRSRVPQSDFARLRAM